MIEREFSLSAHQKIYHLGDRHIKELFDDEVIIQEKVDGSYQYDTSICLADGSTEKIGKIVNQKMQVDVLTYNLKTKNIEIKPITNWFDNGSTDEWLKITVEAYHGKKIVLVCTPNHRFLKGDKYVRIDSLKIGDFLERTTFQFNEIQKQMILGSVIGDMSCSNKKLCLSHCDKQKCLLELKSKILLGLYLKKTNYSGGYNTNQNRLDSLITPETKYIFDLCYSNKGKKQITNEWLKQLTPLSLAFWYMDDGHLNSGNSNKQKGYAIFHTEGYSIEENILLIDCLSNRFNLNCKIRKYTGSSTKKQYNMIALTTESTNLLFSLIAQYIIPNMRYKIYKKYHDYPCFWDYFDFTSLCNKIDQRKILKIEKYLPKQNHKFDITTDDNHNFLVHGIITHNSQFGFAKYHGDLHFRSKGKVLYDEDTTKSFGKIIIYLKTIIDKIPDNHIFYGEYLEKPKQNALNYLRTPKHNLAIFAMKGIVGDLWVKSHHTLEEFANDMDFEVAPLLFQGTISCTSTLEQLLDRDSFLGNEKIEGFVVKNYYKEYQFANMTIPFLAGKYVREDFKEKNHSNQRKNYNNKGKLEELKEELRTEARWNKAIQCMRDDGDLTHTPKDIGSLIQQINSDIVLEEEEYIKGRLYSIYKKDILRFATYGFPEYYKEQLMKEQFDDTANN